MNNKDTPVSLEIPSLQVTSLELGQGPYFSLEIVEFALIHFLSFIRAALDAFS